MKANFFPILLADDDKEDYILIKEAFNEACISNKLIWVKDGEELMDYLLFNGKYQDPKEAPRPSIIILDLNMPQKDGREALKEIKENPDLRRIPVIAFTVSGAEKDINYCYDNGVNCYIRKPMRFSELVDIATLIKKFWIETIELSI